MTLRCAIFDLDGTLAHTAPDLVATTNALIAREGLPPMSLEQAGGAAGIGAKALIRRAYALAGRACDDATTDRLYQPFLEVYATRIADESHLYDDVVETLEALAADGWRLGVCTNKPERLARDLLDRLGILPRFASMIGADTLPVRKPDPRPLLAAVERAGGTVGRTVMIGDTETDLRTARNAEIPCVLTTFGYAAESVHLYKPDAIVSGYGALEAELARLAARFA